MAGPLDIDDDMQRMVLRKGEATAKGGHAFQRLLQLAETRDSGQVRRVALFNEKNPLPEVAEFRLSPRAGRAVISTRIRLADSQRVIAVAEMSDGSFWQASAEVIVTLAACVEG